MLHAFALPQQGMKSPVSLYTLQRRYFQYLQHWGLVVSHCAYFNIFLVASKLGGLLITLLSIGISPS